MGVTSEDGGEVNGAGAFRSIKAPDGFWAKRIHVHGFGSVTPAGGDGEGKSDIFAGEEGIGRGRFGCSADALVGNDAFEG